MDDITKKEFYSQLRPMWIEQSGLDEAAFAREVSFAIQHTFKNPYLTKCEQTSVLRAIMNVAQIRLTLNPVLKYAYLIPRYNSKTKQVECALEPSYIGLAKLATDSGAVRSLECNIIWEGDEIIINKSSAEKVVKHTPYYLNKKEKGKILAVYSLAVLPDGTRHFEDMSYQDIIDIRDRSESYKAFKEGKVISCIWISDEGEMFRKTNIKRHSKYLPKSGGTEKLDKAIDLDNEINGFREAMDFGMLQFLETSIDRSTIDPDRKAKLKKEMSAWQYKDQAYKLMDELSECMLELGTQQTPHSIEEQGKAIRSAVARDDFHDDRKNKKQ